MISVRRGQTSHHKLLQDERIDSHQQSVNQYVTIKYRYALASLVFLSISILFMLSVSDVKTNYSKLAFAILGIISLALSFGILGNSNKITSNNDIHNTED